MRHSARATVLAAMLVAAGGTSVLAHEPDDSRTPVCHCWYEGREVVCEAGHANGSPERHAPIAAFTNTDGPVWSGKTDGKGRARFPRLAGSFYVLIGDKRGDTFELDWRDIAITPPRGR